MSDSALCNSGRGAIAPMAQGAGECDAIGSGLTRGDGAARVAVIGGPVGAAVVGELATVAQPMTGAGVRLERQACEAPFAGSEV